jgi:hypothetical protein
MLVNPYTPGAPFKNFPMLDQQINEYYDEIFEFVPGPGYNNTTPRFKLDSGLKFGFRDIFYCIDQLYDNNPMSVIDVGCGECIWKRWFPNIIGFDPTPSPYANHDFIDYFDEEFSRGHKEKYDSGIALNSIHFVSWVYVRTQLDLAMNMIKPNGRFLFTFNFYHFDKHTPDHKFTSQSQRIEFMDSILASLPYKVHLLDYPTLHGIDESQVEAHAHLNGHVRIILEKNQ